MPKKRNHWCQNRADFEESILTTTMKVLRRVRMIHLHSQMDMPDIYTVWCSLVFRHVNYNVYYKCISDSWNTKLSRDFKFGYIFFRGERMTPMSFVSFHFFLFISFIPHTDWIVFHSPVFLLYVVAQWRDVGAVACTLNARIRLKAFLT